MADDFRMMEAHYPDKAGVLKEPQQPGIRELPGSTFGENASFSPERPAHLTKLGRSRSGEGVRRLLGAQWSQRLQSHLKQKMEMGPSTHGLLFDGEASNSNVLALVSAKSEPTQDSHNLSSSRLEHSITGEIISAGWLLSPKKSSKNNSSNIVHNASSKNNSYNNLDGEHELINDKDIVTARINKSSSDSRSMLFPSASTSVDGSSSTLFAGVNDFLNMSSGMSANNINMELSARDEFTLVRQAAPRNSSNVKSPSRLSLFGGNKSRPKLSKQLTDFRRRRQSKSPEEDHNVNDGTEHFSVTTEKLSSHTARDEGEEDIYTSASSEVEEDSEDLDPATPSPNKTRPHSVVRRLNASDGFHLVENVLSAQLHRYELKNEIEQRRDKFKIKLTLSPTEASVAAGKDKGKSQTGFVNDNDSIDFAKDLQERLFDGDNSAQIAADTQEMDRQLTSSTQNVMATGQKPRRAQSSSGASFFTRMSNLLEDKSKLSKIKKSASQGVEDGDRKVSAMEALFFDDDDSIFFGNKAGGKKQTNKKEGRTGGIVGSTTGSVDANERTFTAAEVQSAATSASPPIPSFPGRPLPAKLTRARTTSYAEGFKKTAAPMTVSPVAIPLANECSVRSNRTMSVRSERSSGSAPTELTALSPTAATDAASETATRVVRGSSRSQRTTDSAGASLSAENPGTTKSPGMKRRATVANLNFERSFQVFSGALDVAGGDDSKGTQDENSIKKNGKKKEFDEMFTSKADKCTTELFHQSFAIDKLVTPTRGSWAGGNSLPSVVADLPNLLENSFSWLSTVDEISLFSRDDAEDRRPRRRNSLPTGSSHGPSVNVLVPPARKTGKPKTSKLGETTPRRRRHRHSLSVAMGTSLLHLQLNQDVVSDIVSAQKAKSAASLAATSVSSGSNSNEGPNMLNASTKMLGIAPSKADAQTARRRKSVKLEPIVKPEPKESQVDKIRMRRRGGNRVQSTTEKGSQPQHHGVIVSGPQSTQVETSTSTNETAAASVSQRRKDRKSKRHSTLVSNEVSSEAPKESAADGVPVKRSSSVKRSILRDGTSGAGSKGDEETRKKSSINLTPKEARRTRRRSTEVEVSPSKTPVARKERVRRNSISDVGNAATSRIPVFNEATIPRVRGVKDVDESRVNQAGRVTPSSLRRISRPKRQTSMDESATKSDKSDMDKSEMDVSDDGSLEPTPKPIVPPSLPVLATRGGAQVSCVKPGRKDSNPRRQKSERSSPKMAGQQVRRKNSEDPSPTIDESEIVSPSARRKVRSRRQTVNECPKDGEAESMMSPGPSSKTTSLEANSAVLTLPNLVVDTEAKPRRAMDKKLMAELCRSPNKANRFRRRSTQNESEPSATKDDAIKSPRPSRRSRRSTSDGGPDPTDTNNDPSKVQYRRRRTEIGDATTPRSRLLRRVRTVGDPHPIPIDVDADVTEKKSEVIATGGLSNDVAGDSLKGKADPDTVLPITNRKLLNEINF